MNFRTSKEGDFQSKPISPQNEADPSRRTKPFSNGNFGNDQDTRRWLKESLDAGRRVFEDLTRSGRPADFYEGV